MHGHRLEVGFIRLRQNLRRREHNGERGAAEDQDFGGEAIVVPLFGVRCADPLIQRGRDKTKAGAACRLSGKRLDIGGMEERADRLGQGVPAAAQREEKKLNETKNFDQCRKKNIKDCISFPGPQSDLVTQHLVVGDFLNVG